MTDLPARPDRVRQNEMDDPVAPYIPIMGSHHVRKKPRMEPLDRMGVRRLSLGAQLYPERPGVDYERPRTRAECVDGPRPCPFVSCRHHLAFDVMPNGNIQWSNPDVPIEEMEHSCSLDIADRGGASIKTIMRIYRYSKETVMQQEKLALFRLRRHLPVIAEQAGVSVGAIRGVDPAPGESVREFAVRAGVTVAVARRIMKVWSDER